MRCCIWWIRGANGGSYLMIFHPIQPYTAFIAVPESAGCGIGFWSIWWPRREKMLGARRSRAMRSSIPMSVKTVAASEERGIDRGKNKMTEKAHRCRCAWEHIVCRCPCRKYPRYKVGNPFCKSCEKALSVHSRILRGRWVSGHFGVRYPSATWPCALIPSFSV